MAAASRSSGLDIPFVETEPVLRVVPARRGGSFPDGRPLVAGDWIADRYRVLRKIGEGGMGVLYACLDTVLSREVALKLMQRSLAAEPALAERLMREARLAAQLRRHVAQVFDCGMLETGEPYIVMELLSGRDMYAVLRDSGPLSPSELCRAMLEACDGLEEAHEKGIIHRDLKPENLFCATEPDGSTVLKIVDFGVSKQLSGRHVRAQTNPTESVGSPQYMSPEQITTPSEVDARTDIWSLGVVMFELLTGALPFTGLGPAQVCASVLTEPVPSLATYRDDVPPALELVLLRCLEKNRERRFQCVAEVAVALRACQASADLLVGLAPLPGDDYTDLVEESDVTAALPPRRRWLGVLCVLAVLGACGAVLGQGVRDGRIPVPSKADLMRVPARIAAWRFSPPWRHEAPEQR